MSGRENTELLAEAGWIGPWSEAVKVCADWSRLHGHRHQIRWSAERDQWRIACVAHVHDRDGRLDRSMCDVCHDAYIECLGCGSYLCYCGSQP